jgi:hypothetical protein
MVLKDALQFMGLKAVLAEYFQPRESKRHVNYKASKVSFMTIA